jgi:predicted RNA binding protein YcfA (HicA-like mRNA interferase family)
MTAMTVIPAKKMVSILLRLGFEFDRQRGSHAYYKHRDGRRCIVPMHAGEDLGKGLIREILRSIDLTVEEYERLRRDA